LNKRFYFVIAFIVLCIIWGSTFMAIKVGLDSFPPLTFAGMRFAIAFVAIYLVMRAGGEKLPRQRNDIFSLLILGFFMTTLPYALLFWGEQFISSGLTSILTSTLPFFVVIIAHFWLSDEKLDFGKIIGLIIGFGGVLLLIGDKLKFTGWASVDHIKGELAILGSSLSYAIATVYAKRAVREMNPLVITTAQIANGIILLPLGLLIEHNARLHFSLSSVSSLLYLALLGSAFAFVLYFWLIDNIGATNVSLVAFATPAVAIVLGIIFLNEIFETKIILGMAAILGGIAIVNIVRKRVGEEVIEGVDKKL